MNRGFVLKAGLAALEIVAALAVILLNMSTSYASVAAIVMMLWIAILCETGNMVFRRGFRVRYLKEYAFLLVPVLLTNAVLAGPAPAWFPTNHSEWILLPFLLFGLASLVRGWIVDDER